jgi:glycine cleavage system H protein
LKKYYDNHEWVDVKDGVGTVGITAAAAKELGNIVYVELPEVGRRLDVGDYAVIVESTKAASEIYSPIAGTVIAVNEELSTSPSLINSSPEDKGWIFSVTSDQ